MNKNLSQKLIELYELGEKEGIDFLNRRLNKAKGSTIRCPSGFTFIIICIKLREKEEYIVLAHEMGHYFMDCTTRFSVPISKAIDEARADKWKAKYLISREKYLEVMRSPFVFNDWEAAQELGVDIESVWCIHEIFKAQGLPISQAELGYVMREP